MLFRNGSLVVFGPTLTAVFGPLYPGDTGTNHIDVTNNRGYWHDYYTAFDNGWWTTN